MKKIYIIGNPVKNSISPTIFNYWFKKYKIKCVYKKNKMTEISLKKNIKKILKSKDCLGANITIPFKEKVQKILDKKDSHAKKIGAINCIYKKDNKLIGTNTDWEGYLKSIKKIKKSVGFKKKHAIIIGYGGAAKAIIYALKKYGFNRVLVFIRNKTKIKKTTKNNKKIKFLEIKDINKHISSASLIINTTPVRKLKDLGIEINLVRKNTIISDINYTPHKTELLKTALTKKLKITYGVEMLIYQAVPAFKLWFGFTPMVTNGLIKNCIKEIKQ
tara:strand:- start:286 stop:1107 length:822 start_codon:yes stop_codon:yes gene_type:complete